MITDAQIDDLIRELKDFKRNRVKPVKADRFNPLEDMIRLLELTQGYRTYEIIDLLNVDNSKPNQMLVGRAMRKFGFERKMIRQGAKTVNVWVSTKS